MTGADVVSLDEVWDRLNDEFIALYARILRSTRTVKWQAAHSDNQFYLLSAYASFARVGRDDDEDLVLEINIHCKNDTVTWTADAGQSAGIVLVDGPTFAAGSGTPLGEWIGDALDQTVSWLRLETPNFTAYLNQEPTPYDVE